MKGQMKAIRRGLFTAVIILAAAGLPARGQYAGGSGTADDPYLIATAEQLNAIGLHPEHSAKHFRLTADIDMNDLGKTPVNLIPTFQGVFDGNDHAIANLAYRVKDEDSPGAGRFVVNIGLFRVISGWDALVKDLGLIDPNVRPDPTCTKRVGNIGALAGGLRQGWIRNCYVKGGYVGGRSMVGGSMKAYTGVRRPIRSNGAERSASSRCCAMWAQTRSVSPRSSIGVRPCSSARLP